MEMISAGEFRKGVTIEVDNNIYNIVDFQHVKPGKGAAFVRTKIKNVVTGSVLERTWNPVEKVIKATIETKKMQFLYEDGGLYYFMDFETFDQLPLNHSQVEDNLVYIKENDTLTLKFYKGQAFSVEPENFVELKVVECEPGVKGDTANNVTKLAKCETGLEIPVPLFVNEGDKIRIDTRDGSYMERIK